MNSEQVHLPKLSEERSNLQTGALLVLAAVAVSFAVAYARSILIPFTLAVFLNYLVAPIVDFSMVRLRFSKFAAVTVALLIVGLALVVMSFLVLLVIQSISDPQMLRQLEFDLQRKLDAVVVQGYALADSWFGVEFDRPDSELIISAIKTNLISQMPTYAQQLGALLMSLVSSTILTTIFVGFMLAGRDPYKVSKGMYAEIDQKIRRYIATKFMISAVTGLLVWIILAFMGMRLASLFGLMAFMLNFIPSVGSIIATLLPIPLAIVDFDSVWMIVLVIALPGAVQMTLGNVIEPKIMGDGLQLHPVTILLSLTLWGMLWGPVGMVLAVPITATMRIVLLRFETTRVIGNLMAGIFPDHE
ncbi:AI-2E family transporter [Blastopirellula marina]|uniref:AI-2E family transporter n=1 Tax=Blastopirellula marina TaxID=124 RepID=A0A2S8GIZ5_9BACT|nr:AI-2E family transporter [Blastopirellula marina]PQO44330.1 hypothetical protein C5Y93_20430 [Blastopirellula marina]